MKRAIFKINEVAANQSSAMDARDHFKNGADLKSQTSRGNFLRKSCFALLAAGIVFSGCDKDDENGDKLETSVFDGIITASVENGSAYNSTVSRVAAIEENSVEEIAAGMYANGGFTLTLPSTPNGNFLYGIEETFGNESDIKYSNKNAKISVVVIFEAYDKDDEYVGEFYCGKFDATTEIDVNFIYADRDVTVTGSVGEKDDTMDYSVSLKKGWNMVYYTENEVSTKEKTGMKWYFWDSED